LIHAERLLIMKKETKPDPIRKRGFSPAEVAAATGLSRATIHRGIRDGTIPSAKFGQRRIVTEATIEKILAPTREGRAAG
jgi:excisionase family DNA binding protein